jgi:hypothetical protein
LSGSFHIQIEGDLDGLAAAVRDEAERYFGILAREIPEAFRQTLDSAAPSGRRYGSHIASAEGQIPATLSGSLYRSIRGEQTGPLEVTVEMAEHAGFLEPLLDGHLNRPFAAESVEAGAIKALSDFQ